jgi:SAM-dependent methyltransferase
MSKKCVVCNNISYVRLTKGFVDYWQCSSCGTIFSEALDNSNMVGGGNEVPRNVEQNYLRIKRVGDMVMGVDKSEVRILDFGCGNGMLIKDLTEAGYDVDGYDAYNEKYSTLPVKDKYHVVTCIECIEHTSYPFVEIDVIKRSLITGGCVMIETSFTDIATEENIPLEDFFYIDPKVGHSTIFSHHGLDVLMVMKGFMPVQHFNRHVRLYKKVK